MTKPYAFMEELAGQCELDGFDRDYAGEFLRPRRDIWPVSPDRFTPLAAKILSALPDRHRRLFHCFLLGCHLLDPEKTPMQAITFLEETPEGDIPPILHDRLLWRTALVPLPVLDPGGKGALRYAIIGCGGGGSGKVLFPEGIELLLDGEAVTAVTNAITLAGRNNPEASCLFWPILDPTDQIRQGSIALPLYLAFESLLSNEPLPPLLATGALDRKGKLLQVDGVREKFVVVRKAGCRGFICPAEEGRDPLAGLQEGDIAKIALETTEDALLFWKCYRDGEGKQLREIITDLEKPGHLIESLPDQPFAFSALPTPLRRRITGTIGKLLQEDPRRGSDSLLHFARKLELLLADATSDLSHSYRLISLVSREMVEQAGKSDPETGLRLALLHLEMISRRGETADSGQTWSRLADGFRQARSNHSTTDEPDQIYIGIREFMSTRHNAYRFAPAEAAEFMEKIRLPLEELKGRFERKRSRNPEQTDKTVGSCLGLLAQHYAFCGNQEKAADFSAQALDAFGHGSTSPLAGDCRQQLIYRTYIALDAGDFPAARGILCGLLGVTNPDEIIPAEVSDPYLHAALAHYMADSGEIFDEYQRYACEILPHCGQQHPWQLWCHNIGDCSASQDMQVRFFSASLERCRRPGQPTIQIMALLPLAALWRLGGAAENELSSGIREVREVIAREAVDQDHFRSIMTVTGWEEVLKVVGREKERLLI